MVTKSQKDKNTKRQKDKMPAFGWLNLVYDQIEQMWVILANFWEILADFDIFWMIWGQFQLIFGHNRLCWAEFG